MMTIKEDVLNSKEKLIETIDKIIEAVDDLPDKDEFSWMRVYEMWITRDRLRIDIPFDPKKLLAFRRRMSHAWYLDHVTQCDDGDNLRAYTHKRTGARLTLVLIPDIEGATCKKVKTGEETVSLYEVRCE